MSTPNSIIFQLQSDLQRANDTTGLSDTTIHDAIESLISGFGTGTGTGSISQAKKFQGETIIASGNKGIEHNCNKTKYLFVISAENAPEDTGGVWYAKTIIGFYDESGINFNNSTYNTVSVGHRVKDGTSATAVWCSNASTSNLFQHMGNGFPVGVKCSWELYDLTYSTSEEQQYQVFETYHDFISGYIGISNYGNNIISIETFNDAYDENGEVADTLPENVTIKYIEIDYNGNTYKLEDIQQLEGREVWVCYHTEDTGLQPGIGGRVVASLYYYNLESYPEFYRAVATDSLEYRTPIRIYY